MRSPPPPVTRNLFDGVQEPLAAALTQWLAQQFAADLDARLEQAGHASDQRISLARVFIDLPVRDGMDEIPEPEPKDGEVLAPGALAELLGRVPGPVGPEDPWSGRRRERPWEEAPEPRGVLLVGGPGQGKSTCGQFLCQLHRAAILGGRSDQLPSREQGLLCGFLEQRSDGLPAPAMLCFPLRVVLSDFADALFSPEREAEASMWAYLAARLALAARVPVETAALRAFLVATPWLLVLDGLDEVPSGPARERMMAAIREFLVELDGAGARGIVVGTTRPQGYQNELGWLAERRLVPLSRARALAYAQRLCDLRFGDDLERHDRVLRVLRKASREGETGHLMRSPLQVTILVTLVSQGGHPPRERWRLFHEYYRVCYAREMERPILAATILRELRPQIDAIHRQVGLILQAETELASGVRSRLPRARFEAIVDATLAAEDFDPATRRARGRTIVAAALHRLVFLVEMEVGQIGFEIRALQELMAAEALTSGSEAKVKERLFAVAASHAFRAVFLFAASKCFANSDFWHLREHIVEICARINRGEMGKLVSVARLGSTLAVSLLSEDVAREAPKFQLKLWTIALEVLELPPHPRQRAVLQVMPHGSESERVLIEALSAKLGAPELANRLPAWLLLVLCIDGGDMWALELGNRFWPAEAKEQEEIVRALACVRVDVQEWILQKLAGSAEHFSPQKLRSLDVQWLIALGENARAQRGWFPAACRAFSQGRTFALEARVGDGVIGGRVNPIEASWAEVEVARGLAGAPLATIPVAWRLFVADCVFRIAPSGATLAEALKCAAEGPAEQAALKTLSWPIAGCLRLARDPDDLRELAAAALRGELGDSGSWRAQESGWAEGLSFEDLLGGNFGVCTPEAGATLPPLNESYAYFPRSRGVDPAVVERVFRAYEESQEPAIREFFADLVLDFIANAARRGVRTDVTRVSRLARSVKSQVSLQMLLYCRRSARDDPHLIELLRELWREKRLAVDTPDDFLEFIDLVNNFAQRNDDDPLVELLAAACSPKRPFPPRLLPELVRMSPLRGLVARLQRGFDEPEAGRLAHQLAERLETAAEEEVDAINLSELAAQARETQAQVRFELALHLALAPQLWRGLSRLDLFTEWYWGQRAGLQDEARWSWLGFVGPAPRAANELRAPEPLGCGRIWGIEVTGVRPFAKATLRTAGEDPAGGQWIVLLGENGVGKSTILRAIALALIDPDVAKAVLASATAPHVRAGQMAAEVEVRTTQGNFRVRIDDHGSTETITSISETNTSRPLVFAYGCRRGSALGGAEREVDFPPIADVATLFDEGPSLIHAETWLKQLRLDAALNPGTDKERIFDAVIEAVRGLLPGVAQIDVRADRVWFEGAGVGRAPLGALSDGYLTTIGWIVDLLARWLHRATQKGTPIGPDFMTHIEGVVLVDEIDLHLHPRWQISVIDEIRRRFPRLSFIVTTHNPLTLLAARKGEIHVLRRVAGTEGIEIVQVDIPPGLRADQVLTGEWFGLASTLDPETLKLIEQHHQMLLRKVGAQAPERVVLEAELRRRLGSFAETSLERLAQGVAAELLGEHARELTPDERQKLRAKLLARVRAQGDT